MKKLSEAGFSSIHEIGRKVLVTGQKCSFAALQWYYTAPSFIFPSSSSMVGSMSSHPSGGGFRLLFTLGMALKDKKTD